MKVKNQYLKILEYLHYIYAFSRRFYPKRLTLHSSYSFTFYQLLLSLGNEPMILALLAPCSTIWATGKPYSTVNAAIFQEILEHFMLPSADKLYGDADFIFQQDLAPAHTAKGTKSWFNDHGVTVLDWPANSPDLNPIENLWCIVKRTMRDTRPNNADELKATVKETWASIPPQQCHKLITSMPRRTEAVIKAKGAPTKYWVHIQ